VGSRGGGGSGSGRSTFLMLSSVGSSLQGCAPSPSVGGQLEPASLRLCLHSPIRSCGKEGEGRETAHLQSSEKQERELQTHPCSSGQAALVAGGKHRESPICPRSLRGPGERQGLCHWFSSVSQGRSGVSVGKLPQETHRLGGSSLGWITACVPGRALRCGQQ